MAGQNSSAGRGKDGDVFQEAVAGRRGAGCLGLRDGRVPCVGLADIRVVVQQPAAAAGVARPRVWAAVF